MVSVVSVLSSSYRPICPRRTVRDLHPCPGRSCRQWMAPAVTQMVRDSGSAFVSQQEINTNTIESHGGKAA